MRKTLVSLLLSLAMLLSAVPAAGAASFHDIRDEEMAVAAATLQGLGVVSGTPDGSFQPNGTLTRAQVCVMAVNMMGLADQVSTYNRRTLFADVLPGAWYNGYVNLAYSQGIINGYGNGMFGPDDIITYGQLSTILLRMLGYTTKDIGSVWPMDYTAFAARLGLSEGMELKDDQSITRGQGAVLFYRTLKSCVNGSDREYYRSISGVKSNSQAIMLEANGFYGGQSGLLKVYDTQSGIQYYNQSKAQSEALEGSLGQLLFDASGKVMGFIPESDRYEDVTIASATASALKDTSGRSLRLGSDVTVIVKGETYTYHNGGYAQLNQNDGKTVRVFYDTDGGVLCLYLTGGTAAASEAAVAESASPLAELERKLGLSGKDYAVTKNGASAGEEALAQYDVGYYDAASNTLRVSDYKVSGFLSSASPSVSAAKTVTVLGHTFEVLECAWDTMEDVRLGDKVTLVLTDDNKVAAVYRGGKLSAEMVGVLNEQGKSVTLSGSGISVSAGTVNAGGALRGELVVVSASDVNTLTCTALGTGYVGVLDMEARTLGTMKLAPAVSVYEWTGNGYVGDLEGNRGSFSTDFDTIDWTDTLSSGSVSGYHLNSAGQVDVILLNDVTGNGFAYGKLNRQESTASASNDTATLTNSAGGGSRYIITQAASSGSYVGIALGGSLSGDTVIVRLQELSRFTGGEFFRQNDAWYVQNEADIYAVSEQVEVHFLDANTWQGGMDGLMAALADGYTLTMYVDRDAQQGGQVRLITAN